MIEQEPFCGVRTHFYHDASLYDMFRDRRVVERREKIEDTEYERDGEKERERDRECVCE